MPPTADELLAHRDWLLGLARALVGDAQAQDIVQDTYEVALAKPPRQPGALRPWLGGVARNLARMTTRGRVRRELREQAIAPADGLPTPETLVERARMQQQVAALVLDLPEQLRTVLLLRFFEGLSAADIARAQRIPAATVRARLAEALARVRAALDAKQPRKQWMALVAPFAKGVAVKKAVFVVVVLILAVVGTRLAGLWGGGGKATAPVATVEQKHTPHAVAPDPVRRALPVDLTDDADPDGTLRLEGQVIDDRDQPVADAQVAIDSTPPRVVTSDASGGFAFEQLIARDYLIEATSATHYGGPVHLRLRDKLEPITLRMHAGGTVAVAVVDDADQPIANAEVELRSALTYHARAGADGVATLTGVGPAWAPLAARADGFAPRAMMVSASGDPQVPQRVRMVLARGAAITGKVVDDKGAPIANARVVPTNASEPFPVVDPRRDGVATGADGAFAIPALAAGTWRLTATSGDSSPASSAPIALDGVHAKDGVVLALGAATSITGRVVDGQGNPVAAADVRVVVRGYTFWRAARSAFTAADGTFAIAGLPRRAVEVVASHSSGSSALTPIDLAATPQAKAELAITIAGAIDGTVVDSAGQAIADAQVTAEPSLTAVADRQAWVVRGTPETVADQNGAFRFPGLPPGSYTVRAARPGLHEPAGDVPAKPGDHVKLVVPAEGRIVGKVAFADGKVPASFTVSIGGGTPVPFATPDGAFAIAAIAGPHALTVDGTTFLAATTKQLTVKEGAPTDAGTIIVQPGRGVSGRVVDETGAPVAGARVAAGALLTGGGAELYIADESIGAKDTVTDADGHYALEGFPPTSITVVAGKDKVGRATSVRLPPGAASATLDLVLQPTSGLDGKVTRDGKPLADTIIIANPIGASSSNLFTQTGPDGTFAIDALPPGPYTVYPMIGGGGPRPKDMYVVRVDVAPGVRAKVAIDATPGTSAFTVDVKGTAQALVVAIEGNLDVKTADELRAIDQLVGDHPIAIYMRMAPAEVTTARPGPHTICAGDPKPNGPFGCIHATLGAAKQALSIDAK